jgi:16S rRNA (guanine527-N7)-methyltransferase
MTNNSNSRLFIEKLESHSETYGVQLTPATITRLETYFELLNEWNPRLHLVASCSPAEFAKRHILESLFLLSYFPTGAVVADIGSGAGLPMIPCLIARPDLRVTLIESSKKKAVFLREALKITQLTNSATVLAEPFESAANLKPGFVTCRALDRFEERLAEITAWAPRCSTLLFFGGKSLGEKLGQLVKELKVQLLPDSRQRFLFIAELTE